MKDSTEKKFFEAPNRVQYIYIMGMMKKKDLAKSNQQKPELSTKKQRRH